jgi:hypothetical protein
MKTCTKCNTEKPLVEFNNRQSQCKLCQKEYANNWQKTTGKSNHKKSNKKYLQKIKAVYGIYDNEECLYVGQSTWFTQRKLNHINKLRHSTKSTPHYKLYEALRQHLNTSIRIIEECSPELLLTQEQYYINTLKPKYNGI